LEIRLANKLEDSIRRRQCSWPPMTAAHNLASPLSTYC
jgi:hypothetical protein